jgi:hypothetical protein
VGDALSLLVLNRASRLGCFGSGPLHRGERCWGRTNNGALLTICTSTPGSAPINLPLLLNTAILLSMLMQISQFALLTVLIRLHVQPLVNRAGKTGNR